MKLKIKIEKIKVKWLVLAMVLCLSVALSPVYAQSKWTIGDDILSANGNGYWVSDADSVFFDDDTLYIAGAETLEVYVNTGRTLGMISLYGTVQNKDTIGYSSTADSVYFYASRHMGSGSARNANISETFVPIDSVLNDGSTVGSFRVQPIANTTFGTDAAVYWTIRIYGKANIINAIWLKEERVFAY